MYQQEYIIERKGEYLLHVFQLLTGHYLCNDIHKLEVSGLDNCGQPHVL